MKHTDLSKPFREKCEWYATDWRKQLNIEVNQYMPGKLLAGALEIHILQPNDMDVPDAVIKHLLNATDWSGVIIHYDPTIILYNPNMTPERVESTIMHELAHILLNHSQEELYLAPNGEYKRNFTSQKELEANYLGSCFQIPRRGLQWSIQNGLTKQQIATRFQASIQMVQWRINALIY